MAFDDNIVHEIAFWN